MPKAAVCGEETLSTPFNGRSNTNSLGTLKALDAEGVSPSRLKADGVCGELAVRALVRTAVMDLDQEPPLNGLRKVTQRVEADIVPDSGHEPNNDNPTSLAERLVRSWRNS